uniref:protein-serine/threonine phosphatase n=1 Tax=Macrostomum lignano TaxID=282301 RepID=A0A1I8GA38_9PLAT
NVDLKDLANRLLTFDTEDVENHVPLTAAECLSVCHMAMEAMRSTDICIHIKTPINIVGDLHGQFHDLLRIFDALGQPPETFQWMPMCAIIDGQIFCCHGGISPNFMLQPFNLRGGQQANVQALNECKKPVEPVRPGILCDIMWSDPIGTAFSAQFSQSSETLTEAKWLPNKRGCSFSFSGQALEEVMRLFQTQMLIRGHQVAMNGYQSQLNRRCVTVFSAPGYCGVYNNISSILQIERLNDDSKSPGSFFLLRPMQRDPSALANLFWNELRDI